MTINPNRAGLALGATLGAWHLLWSALVALGWAQAVADFVFWMHFIKPVYVIEPFAVGRALILIAVTSIVGYVFGAGFGMVWSWLHKGET